MDNIKLAEYIAELNDRFKDGSDYDIKDVTDFMRSQPDHDGEIIFKCIIANHSYKGFPKLPTVKKYLKADGIDLRSRSDSEVYHCQVCDICKTKFASNMSACPTCKKRTTIKMKMSDKPISHVKIGHDDCGYCEIYFRSSKGSICESWGKEEKPEGNQYCNGCTCVDCCKKEYLKNHNYGEYRREVLGFGA